MSTDEPAEGHRTTYEGTSSRDIFLFGAGNHHTVCNRMVEKARRDTRVLNMAAGIARLGCSIDLNTLIECKPCGVAATGGFIANDRNLKEGDYKPKVIICEDNLLGHHYVAQTMAHELTHAYDQCRAKMSWNSDYHHACTEIRASALSGECDLKEELNRGIFGWRGQHRTCVKRRAMMSLEVTGYTKERAQQAIDKVFERCYNDTAPFDRIP